MRVSISSHNTTRLRCSNPQSAAHDSQDSGLRAVMSGLLGRILERRAQVRARPVAVHVGSEASPHDWRPKSSLHRPDRAASTRAEVVGQAPRNIHSSELRIGVLKSGVGQAGRPPELSRSPRVTEFVRQQVTAGGHLIPTR